MRMRRITKAEGSLDTTYLRSLVEHLVAVDKQPQRVEQRQVALLYVVHYELCRGLNGLLAVP